MSFTDFKLTFKCCQFSTDLNFVSNMHMQLNMLQVYNLGLRYDLRMRV